VKTLENWVNAYNAEGFSGIQDEPRPGRPSTLTQDDRDQLEQDLRADPREFGYSQNLWDGKLLSHHIQKTFGKSLSTRQCQRLFHTLGFRQRKPRPLIASSDPELQESFKKTE
jgi:transposase